VFSGDTSPSGNLVQLARGADILVHEVMDLRLIGRALEFDPRARTLRKHLLESHTPMTEVGRIATEAGVKTLVLNHFVPGIVPIPDDIWYDAVKPHFKGRVIVGRDLMVL
jgi:ribonuclease BN (tRNA processing enzyme)